MSFRTRVATLALAVVAVSGTAYAAVECPPTAEARPATRLRGGALYEGDLADRAILAPDQQNAGGREVNVWRIQDPSKITLVCEYNGLNTPLTFSLPSGTRTCTQTYKTGGFSCK